MPKTTMLIVEDQAYMRRLLREFLQMAYPEAEILEAGDGGAALALCREHRPRLVLMDVRLPDANGIELTAQLKAAQPDAAFIIVSAHASAAYVEHAQTAGACAYVIKDNVYSDLLEHVRHALQPAGPDAQGRLAANG